MLVSLFTSGDRQTPQDLMKILVGLALFPEVAERWPVSCDACNLSLWNDIRDVIQKSNRTGSRVTICILCNPDFWGLNCGQEAASPVIRPSFSVKGSPMRWLRCCSPWHKRGGWRNWFCLLEKRKVKGELIALFSFLFGCFIGGKWDWGGYSKVRAKIFCQMDSEMVSTFARRKILTR